MEKEKNQEESLIEQALVSMKSVDWFRNESSKLIEEIEMMELLGEDDSETYKQKIRQFYSMLRRGQLELNVIRRLTSLIKKEIS